MINELIKRTEKADYDDDLEYLQLHLNNWLKDGIAKALTEGLCEK